MKYTIKKLANLAGVSVRTLHYYDEVGLLSPSLVGRNKYRYYEEKELLRLQQILFFRELEFSLERIKEILNSPSFRLLGALTDQKKLLRRKNKRIDGLILLINNTMKKLKQKSEIKNPQELYDPFKDKDYLDYKDEAERKWGNTSAYKQSMERVKKMTKQDMEKLKSTNEILTKKLAKSMDSNIKSKQVQDLIEEHYKGICFFYDCSLDMYRNLATMYVEDPRFAAYYEKFRLGLAQFMKQAIEYYCDVQQQKN